MILYDSKTLMEFRENTTKTENRNTRKRPRHQPRKQNIKYIPNKEVSKKTMKKF